MRYRPPVLSVIGSSLMSSLKLFIIVPYQNRPCRSHLPSFERFLGLSLSGETNGTACPVLGSKNSMLDRVAMMRPPDRRTEMAVTISGIDQLVRSSVAGYQRLIVLDGTSVQ